MVEHESRPRLLPRLLPLNSPGYYVFLALVAVLILGPLGGITASYMNFSLGFFVGGQVLAGILGSTITYFYGPEGKHGANYMQTAAASVASMAAMGVLIQAMVWLGLPEPPTWHLFLYFLCVGMFGVGVGMLYTPLLVDKLRLTYPSGLAVANILRALTDVRLLKASVGKLFGGMGVGAAVPTLIYNFQSVGWVKWLEGTGIFTSTLGAGMIVGARVGIPAIVYGFLWVGLTPWMREQGFLGPADPFRKFAFLVALGTIMGAAVVDITLILREALQKVRGRREEAGEAQGPPVEEWKRVNTTRLLLWLAFWMVAVVVVTHGLMQVPLHWVLMCVGLAFVMMLVNGISFGITDWNPISSAFVISVVAMAALGLLDPVAGLLAGSIVFVGCAVGGDMQQDRSTGWRLGTNRTNQFRFQVIGILLGAVLAVFMAKWFMQAYPVLTVDTFSHPEQKVDQWQSAMTYKFVGALRGLTSPAPAQIEAMLVGFAIGLVIEIARKLVKRNERYKAWSKQGRGSVFDFIFDCVLLPSPYASSFAGFVELRTSLWFGGGSALSWAWNGLTRRRPARDGGALPEDMSTTSLVGGGLIAGDAIAALIIGVAGLAALMA